MMPRDVKGDDREPDAPIWAPLRRPVFRALWIAAFASNVGTWVQEVGAAWLMTSLTPSPAMIALVQVATTLPIFLLALVAGALADVLDRRRLLLLTQGWMFAASAALGVLANLGLASPWGLLVAIFGLGVGTALNAPAWQAIIPELVPSGELPAALALNGVGINLARAAGPAMGGLVVAAAGPGAAFLLNAASFVGVLLVLFRWRRPPRLSVLPGERILGAVKAGLRYARHSPELRSVLARSGAFALFASALWALLPVVVRFDLRRGPAAYGAALGFLGAGAVAGAIALPRLRNAWSPGRIATVAGLLFSAALLLMAVGRDFAALGAALLAGGAAWLVLLTTFHSGAQAALAPWVRGRGLSVLLFVFFGGMAGGSALWGAIASAIGPRAAVGAAGIGSAAAILLTSRLRLPKGGAVEVAPSRHWPAAALPRDEDAERGPVLVVVEYLVEPSSAAEFRRAMADIRRIRLRDGAFRWDLLIDPDRPGRHLESFLVESWMEHLRQHERFTGIDREIERRARRLHLGPHPPRVSHFIAKDLPR
jgi:MFS family permease